MRKSRGTWAWAMIALASSLSLVLSGCLWGVVRDAGTGQPISGAQVTFYDMVGNTGTTTTNQNGLYSFDAAEREVPVPGAVAFQVSAPGYQTLGSQRNVQYDDNADGTWEIQSFSLVKATEPSLPGAPG